MGQPATQAPLDTAELLEAILFSLDSKTFRVAQRVSKTWKKTVEKSPKLQVKLFFKLPPKLSLREQMHAQSDTTINELLLEPGSKRYRHEFDPTRIDPRLLHSKVPFVAHHLSLGYDSKTRTFGTGFNMDLRLPVQTEEVESSWKRMYLARAGVVIESASIVKRSWSGQQEGKLYLGEVWEKPNYLFEGITMGEVVEEAVKHL